MYRCAHCLKDTLYASIHESVVQVYAVIMSLNTPKPLIGAAPGKGASWHACIQRHTTHG